MHMDKPGKLTLVINFPLFYTVRKASPMRMPKLTDILSQRRIKRWKTDEKAIWKSRFTGF